MVFHPKNLWLSSAAGRMVFFAVVLMLVFACAINGQSLWIDEACAAFKARQPDLAGWWGQMLREKGSDLQMPVYMFWIWLCGKIFGAGELALRAVNFFWFAPGLLALLWALSRRVALQLAVFLAVVTSPFVWSYVNEARPYAMQLGASLFLLAALFHWSENPITTAAKRGWVCGVVMALVVLAGSSLLGMIWAVAAVAILMIVLPVDDFQRLIRRHAGVWLTGLVSLVLLGGYYLWTLKFGARASAVGATGWKSPVFIIYELSGFVGLGPGRLEIRESNGQGFQTYGMALAGFAGLAVILSGLAGRQLFQSGQTKKWLAVALWLAMPATIILAAGLVLHFRVLGRHFTPLAPVWLFFLAVGVGAAWQWNRLGRAVVIGYFLLCLVSCLSLRFAARHEKDDYRTAVALAKAALARGQSVWWNADDSGAAYYQLPLATNGVSEHGKALKLDNPRQKMLLAAGRADVIIVSRHDVYDGHGAVAEFLAATHYRPITNLPAFSVWERGQIIESKYSQAVK